MEPLTVRTEYPYSPADIKARVTDEGGVKIWWYYRDIRQERHTITCTPEEWDRFVAWVEWQRKDKGFNKEES